MEDNKSMETTAESVGNTSKVEDVQKTFTRDELNKIVSTEKAKVIEEYKQQIEAEKIEADKYAKMKSDEKLQYQLDKANKEKDDALAQVNAYKLKEEAIKVASEKGLDASLLNLIDFKTITAEKLNENINNLSTVFNKAVENQVNNKLKESAPITKTGIESKVTTIPSIF